MLSEAIALVAKDDKQKALLRVLTDPARRGDSLATVLADVGMYPSEVLQLFRDANFARAFTIAQHKMADAVPDVVDDIVEKAVDRFEPCVCRITVAGDFSAPANPECLTCGGTGQIFKRSSIDHQQMIFDAMEIVKKAPGMNLNVNQQVGVAIGESYFDRLVKATDPAALDVKVIDVSEDVDQG